MYPRWHIILGFAFSLLLLILFPAIKITGALLIFLSSFLIDVDHYLYYVFSKRDLSLRNSLRLFDEIEKKSKKVPRKDRKHFYSGIYFLHGAEAIIILCLLSYLSSIFLLILLGFLFHEFLDFIELSVLNESYDKLISFSYSLYKVRYKKSYQLVKK